MHGKKLLILSFIICLCGCSIKETTFKKYSFYHQQGTSDYSDYMYYDDSIFEGESTTFNPSLASASIGVAMASFASMKTTDYKEKSVNIRELSNKMGFIDFTVNDGYLNKPGTDTIGLIGAHKRINDYEVVLISVRGAAYFSEWASNFTIGKQDDGYHDGFKKAADEYINFTKEYFNKFNITGDVKLWSSAYSRGGATLNIASGLIDDALNKNEKIFGENVNLTRNHFYSYCFEPPKGSPNTKDENGNIIIKGEEYNNIFNLLNVNDPIPLVAPTELGFSRYGQDLYFPDPLTTLNYQKHFSNMNALYNKISNHQELGNYPMFNFQYKSFSGLKGKDNENAHNMSQALFLRELVTDLVKYGLSHLTLLTKEEILDNYNDKIQPGVRNLFAMLYEGESFKGSFMDIASALVTDLGIANELDILVSDLTVEGLDAFMNDIKPIITRGFHKLKLDVDVDNIVNGLINALEAIGCLLIKSFVSGKQYQLFNFINKDNLKALIAGHYPELNAAHVRALDSNYVDNPFTDYEKLSGQYYKLFIENDESIQIKHNNELIVNIGIGKAIKNRISYIKRKTGYEIYLPYYEKYEVKINKDSNVELSYFDNNKEDYINIDLANNPISSFVIG